jgi:hypothetical protein
MGGEHFNSQTSGWVFVHVISNYFQAQQAERNLTAKRLGFLCDGSADAVLRELEVAYVRYETKPGVIDTEFWEMLEIDRTLSVDGKKRDGQAVFRTIYRFFVKIDITRNYQEQGQPFLLFAVLLG